MPVNSLLCSAMSFSFSFNLESVEGEILGSDLPPVEAEGKNSCVEADVVSCFEVTCPVNLLHKETSIEFSTHNVGELVFKEALPAEPDHSFDEESDLIPGKYEGGFKIWECSYDLARIIVESPSILPNNPKTILELGCGHGVPAIISMLVFDDLTEVIFSDFNSEVLEFTTWPNIIVNFPSKLDDIRCIAGDWATLSSLIGKFDLILSAETLYTVESCRKVFDMVAKHLNENGVALIASKKYYFGVGGGTLELENLAAKSTSSLQYTLVKSFEDGQSNIREVIKLTTK